MLFNLFLTEFFFALLLAYLTPGLITFIHIAICSIMKERELVINYLVSYRRTEQSMLRYLFAFTCKLQFAILKLLRLQHEIPVCPVRESNVSHTGAIARIILNTKYASYLYY